eukprot:GFUD01007106.1.p1 GENE.GFUD01007106.1~~GFUD01007106.1.p1  ORF type:complete len:751 (-),score=215.74 GFUD01007106.1:6-2258(-)
MGVKDVWHVAGPCEERISLHSLRGSTLAIDLAGWVVQNQTAPGLSHSVTRPHLRNLFFRVNTLLSLDILPVVVLDGVCPVAKAATVQARNALTWGTKVAGVPDSPKKQQRRQFAGVLKDCQKLMLSLGVPCVTAPGEAEAYCAALNRAGLVDAVVSDDSDCFCYGAKTVLKNFSADPKNFSVSSFTTKRIRQEVELSRQRMVIMALILGCDYNPGGVCGVGREALVKLFTLWGPPGRTELDTVMSWRDTGEEEVNLSKPVHCGTCGHPGSVGSHRKAGCGVCGTAECGPGIECQCEYHSPQFQLKMAEWSVKKKAVSSPGWPFNIVVQEFYKEPKSLPSKFSWTSPRPAEFVEFSVRRMNWVKDYCIEKVVETVVRWQVRNPHRSLLVIPQHIVKKRIKAGENMLEVQWAAQDAALPSPLVACVPSTEFSEAYPQVYQEYEDMLAAKEAAKKKPKKKKDKENVAPKEKKGKTKKNVKNQPTLDAFINKENRQEVESEEINISIKKPSSIIFKKISSSDPKFNNLVINKKLVTPKANAVLEVANSPEDLDYSDTYVYNPEVVPEKVSKPKSSEMFNSMVMSDSMRQYMDDSDSDLSGIIDDIIGNKKPDTVSNILNQMNNLSIHVSTSTPSNNHIPKHLQTSTPYGSGSPLLKKVQHNLLQKKVKEPAPKASNVFDISDVSFMMEDNMEPAETEEDDNHMSVGGDNENLSGLLKSHDGQDGVGKDDSFDEFDCLDNPSITPFAERVRKKLK